MFTQLPESVQQMSMIFLSIVIEALPFVLLGCLISGALSVFLTPARVQRLLPKNKLASIVVGCGLGVFFPSCECGIVPSVNQFVKKDVPVHTAFAFMLTAPIVNPIVIFSTFIAFGNSPKFAALRVMGSVIVAMMVGIWLAYFNQTEIIKEKLATQLTCETHHHHHEERPTKFQQLKAVMDHGIDEFFDTGRYLIIGGLIASAMQTYLPTGVMLTLGSTKFLAILVMLLLAFVMSLCSEADAFIGSSLLSLFGTGPVVAFLVFGPMVDIKNLMMMNRYFSSKFILTMIAIIFVCVTGYAWVV